MRLKPITEREFTDQVIRFAKLHGWMVLHIRPGRTAKGWRTPIQGDGKGFPDLLLIRGDRLIVAELKVGKNKLTAEQQQWLSGFRAAWIPAYEWRPEMWESIVEVLK